MADTAEECENTLFIILLESNESSFRKVAQGYVVYENEAQKSMSCPAISFFLHKECQCVVNHFGSDLEVLNFLVDADPNKQLAKTFLINVALKTNYNLEKVRPWGLVPLHVLQKQVQICIYSVLNKLLPFNLVHWH